MKLGEIRPLTGIRAVAALWVVLLHFREPILALADGPGMSVLVDAGYLGVDLFFVLSGFVISLNYVDKLRFPNVGRTREFLLLRLARIYPVHLATLAITGILVLGAAVLGISVNSLATYDLRNGLMNVLMIQAIPPGDAWNPPAWSISVEFGAYLVFPVLALVLVRLRNPRVAFAAAAVVVVLAAIVFAEVASKPRLPGYTFAWCRIALEFTIGCLLYRGWALLKHPRSKAMDLVVLVGLSMLFISIWTQPVRTMFNPGLTIAGISFIIIGCAGATGLAASFLGSRVMTWGGRISYSVYMTHFLIATVLGKVVDWHRWGDSPVILRAALLLGCLAFVLVVGDLMYRLVEEPSRKYLRRHIRSAETTVADG